MQKQNLAPPTKSDAAEAFSKPPLWMPPGSIRAILTIAVVAVYFSMSWKGMEVSETFNTIVVTVIAFYFGTRTASPTKVYDEYASTIENIQQGGQSIYDKMPDRNPANPEMVVKTEAGTKTATKK